MVKRFYRFFVDNVTGIYLSLIFPGIDKGIRIVKYRLINSKRNNIYIGKDFFAGEGIYISLSCYTILTVGQAVMLGPEVMILGGNHKYSYRGSHLRYYRIEDESARNITIEDGVWVGARVTILSGAIISEGAIVGACSLVNKYIPPYSIAVGVPVKVIKPRFSSILELEEMLNNVESSYSVSEILSIYKEFGIIL